MYTDTDPLTPVAVLPGPSKRRRKLTNWKLCMFCQNVKENESVSVGLLASITQLKTDFKTRQSLGDIFLGAIPRLADDIDTLEEYNPKWHRSCYASFTSDHNINGLSDRRTTKNEYEHEETCVSNDAESQTPLTRRVVQNVDWKKCIFCQNRKTKKRREEKVHKVQSNDVHNDILNAASTMLN